MATDAKIQYYRSDDPKTHNGEEKNMKSALMRDPDPDDAHKKTVSAFETFNSGKRAPLGVAVSLGRAAYMRVSFDKKVAPRVKKLRIKGCRDALVAISTDNDTWDLRAIDSEIEKILVHKKTFVCGMKLGDNLMAPACYWEEMDKLPRVDLDAEMADLVRNDAMDVDAAPPPPVLAPPPAPAPAPPLPDADAGIAAPSSPGAPQAEPTLPAQATVGAPSSPGASLAEPSAPPPTKELLPNPPAFTPEVGVAAAAVRETARSSLSEGCVSGAGREAAGSSLVASAGAGSNSGGRGVPAAAASLAAGAAPQATTPEVGAPAGGPFTCAPAGGPFTCAINMRGADVEEQATCLFEILGGLKENADVNADVNGSAMLSELQMEVADGMVVQDAARAVIIEKESEKLGLDDTAFLDMDLLGDNHGAWDSVGGINVHARAMITLPGPLRLEEEPEEEWDDAMPGEVRLWL